MPRSANKSSTSRKLKCEPEIEPDRLLDDLGREAVATYSHLGHHRWLQLKSLRKCGNVVCCEARQWR